LPFEQRTLERGGLDDLGPVLRRNVAAIAPLAYRYAQFADVSGQCFSVIAPDGINGLEVRHADMIQPVSPTSIPIVSRKRIKRSAMSALKAERLRSAREKAGYSSAADAARAFGWAESAYRHHENGTRGFGADAAKKYGRAFKVMPGWLLGLESVDRGPLVAPREGDKLVVNGSVEAGAWRSSEVWDDERTFTIEGMPSPIEGARRFGLCVVGRSMDEFYEPDTVLDCVSIFDTNIRPETGDHVICEQIKPDGLRELTVKEYREEGGRYWLCPRSTRPEFKPVEYPGPDVEHTDPGEMRVIAYVVGSIPPRTLRLLKRMGKVHPV
jgi:SOS-response transcriptional repressor LexA